jgi:hypothetical protein
MLENLLLKTELTTHSTVINVTQMDPLEQFDVLTVALPFVGNVGFTNLALLLTFNLIVMVS